MGFVPGIPEVELDPELVLVVFLPPLLYSAAFFASLRDLRYDIRSISMLAIGLVIATACSVAVVAHALIDGLPWAAAFALGAIVGADRPAGRDGGRPRVGLPRRIATILEGESLINDGTALVIYRVAVGAVGGGFSLAECRAGVRARRGGRDRDRPRRRLGDRRAPQAARRPARGGHHLAADRLRGLRAGRARGRLGRAGRGDDRHLHRLAGAGDLERAAAGGGLLDVDDPDVPAQRAAVRADRAAAAADPRGPRGRAARRADRRRGRRLGGGDRLPAGVDAPDDRRDPGARPAAEPARAPRHLARPHGRGLGRHARRGLAGRRARAPLRLPGARPAAVHHLRRDPRDARAPGAHAARP